jgi:hypothetical protein
MHKPPVKYLILIDAGGSMVARLFDGSRRLVTDIDAGSEEVAVMTTGLAPTYDGADPAWSQALAGHSVAQRRAAQVFTLDV